MSSTVPTTLDGMRAWLEYLAEFEVGVMADAGSIAPTLLRSPVFVARSGSRRPIDRPSGRLGGRLFLRPSAI